jgi:hypothetical protein
MRKALRVPGPGVEQDGGAFIASAGGQAVVQVVRREHADAAVAVLAVVPVEEDAAVHTGVLDRAEAPGKVWPILQRLELRLGERLSSEMLGREWLFVTPRSARSRASDFDVIDVPRSA